MIRKLKEQVSTHSIWTFYGRIESFDSYAELLEDLEKAQQGDMITLYFNCSGGDCAIGESIIRALHITQATTNCIVEAPCWSMGSIVALQCDNLYFNEDTFLMFHDYSTGYRGKGSEMSQMMSIEQENTNKQIKKWCMPFLTKKEYDNIVSGTDVYIKWDDPTMKKRLKRHFGSKACEKS